MANFLSSYIHFGMSNLLGILTLCHISCSLGINTRILLPLHRDIGRLGKEGPLCLSSSPTLKTSCVRGTIVHWIGHRIGSQEIGFYSVCSTGWLCNLGQKKFTCLCLFLFPTISVCPLKYVLGCKNSSYVFIQCLPQRDPDLIWVI